MRNNIFIILFIGLLLPFISNSHYTPLRVLFKPILKKTIGVVFRYLCPFFSHNSNELTKSFKVNFLKLCLLFIAALIFPNTVLSQETGGPYTKDANTVLLMHFEDNADNSADIGVNGIQHGSGVSYETGIHGNCIRLDNSTSDKQSWIEVPFYDELNLTEEFSIECWFKINSWGDGHTGLPILFKKGEVWPADYNLELGASENRLQANLNCQNDEYDRGFDVGTYPGVIQQGKWYHISLSFKPNTDPEYWMYMDLLIRDENYNEIYASIGFGSTPPFNSDGKLFIGFGNNGNTFFDGWIDEFRISNKHRKYRDDIIAEINTENLKDSVPPMLRDRWTVYYPPIINYFPIDTVTGKYKGNSCGMTIMIRMLHFWEHPRFPSGNLDYWFGQVHWQADFDNTEYLFDLMPNKFGSAPTEEEYGPSAIFAQQVSAATRIYYDNMSSMPQLLTDYFHYKKGMKLYFRNQFTKEEWIKIFKHELSHGRPIMAAGLEEVYDEGGAAGHYYIVDGYNSEGKFHSDESFGEVDFWVDIDSFPYGKFQTIFIGTEPDWQGKTLTLDYPKGGEYFEKQTEIRINWISENINTLLLEYTSDGGRNWETINESVDASLGKYNWTIPEISSIDYKIRISDTEDGNIYRRCNTFDVYGQQTLSFEYPISATYFQAGSTQPIYWQSEGIPAFKLEYSIGQNIWEILCDSVNAAAGIYNTIMPDIDKNNVILRATDLTNTELFFLSDTFQIKPEKLIGGVHTMDDETVLLMHFEEDILNSSNNNLIPNANYVGKYEDHFDADFGKSYRFDNSDGTPITHNIWIDNSEDLDLGNNWTLEAWVKVISVMGEKTALAIIIDKWDAFGINGGWGHFNGFVNFENGTNVKFHNPEAYLLNEWYHVAMISNASSEQIYFYIHDKDFNEIYESSQAFPDGSSGLIKQNENLLKIGGLGGASNCEFDGYMDELRISKTSYQSNYIEYAELPFYDEFENEYENWSTSNIAGSDTWHISGDDGIDLSKCARFYIRSNPQQANDDWLLTPLFNTSRISNLRISFKYLFHSDGIIPEFYYANNFDGDLSNSTWIKIDNSFWKNMWSWNDALIEIENSGETFVFAIRYQSTDNLANYVLIDNFKVFEESLSAIITSPNLSFKIYPNPINEESIISFNNTVSGKVNLTLFDIHGRKVCTILDKELSQGNHEINIWKFTPDEGVYFCRLSTSSRTSTIKYIVDK